jgi:hypothetical protein
MLQPLNVVINQPFKAHIRRSYIEWAQKTREHETTPTGHLKRAMLMEKYWWILEAWRHLSQDMIAKSFKVTGISKKMDGSEGNLLWHRSDEESYQEEATDSEEN